MWANMKAQFVLDGPRIHLDRIDLDTDGATTVARGDVDIAHWPEQTLRRAVARAVPAHAGDLLQGRDTGT